MKIEVKWISKPRDICCFAINFKLNKLATSVSQKY